MRGDENCKQTCECIHPYMQSDVYTQFCGAKPCTGVTGVGSPNTAPSGLCPAFHVCVLVCEAVTRFALFFFFSNCQVEQHRLSVSMYMHLCVFESACVCENVKVNDCMCAPVCGRMAL